MNKSEGHKSEGQKIFEILKRSITIDNVNEIPQDWEPIAQSMSMSCNRELLSRLKERKLGFLPWIVSIVIPYYDYDLLMEWFLKAWSPYIDLNVQFPYNWLHRHNDPYELMTSVRWALGASDFCAVRRLLMAGAQATRADFYDFTHMMDNNLFTIQVQCAHAFLESGAADYELKDGHPWLVKQCQSYGDRRRHCQMATKIVGVLLRHRRRGWDRFLIRQVMRVIWATRRNAAWKGK